MKSTQEKVGFLTTYNQRCGLATYASYVLKHFGDTPYVVLAEEVMPNDLRGVDEANVVRCWRRLSNSFQKLEAAIREHNLNVLHLNCQYSFFDCNQLGEFLVPLKKNGLKVVSHVHNPMTLNLNLQALIRFSDKVIVHTEENRIEVLANGAQEEQVEVIEHGVDYVLSPDRKASRRLLNISEDEEVIVTFGFIRKHKGIEYVIKGLADLLVLRNQRRISSNTKLYIVGNYHHEDPASAQYIQSLKNFAAQLGVSDKVVFVSEFVEESVVQSYLTAANVIVMNYQTDWYEASGALALALGSGSAVITSLAPPFHRLGSAVFHTTNGYPLASAIELVLSNAVLRNALERNARVWSENYSWPKMTEKFLAVYQTIREKSSAPVWQEAKAPVFVKDVSTQSIRVLMQNRSNAFTQRGGDTVLMERLTQGLNQKSVRADIDLTGDADLKEYDIVHLYNFAIREYTEKLARRAVDAQKPFVVTTMYEDWPVFFSQMDESWRVILDYIRAGQRRELWPVLAERIKNVTPTGAWDNTWTAHHAEVLIASGRYEANALRRDYPQAKRIEFYLCGCDITDEPVDGSLFRDTTGIKEDFVLCVGRLETRKNQLMLLKALEDSTIPVVFATGGFTYQADYEKLCRLFMRRGNTHFLGRLDPKVLKSAYVAARAHVLPSWFELPGIVSLEAASLGTNVVATKYGTLEDHLGEDVHYCEPGDVDSIRVAVENAFNQAPSPKLKEIAKSLTWEATAKRNLSLYEQVLSGEAPTAEDLQMKQFVNPALINVSVASANAREASEKVSQIPIALERSVFGAPRDAQAIALCEQGDFALRASDSETAKKHYKDAWALSPSSPRAPRSLGVVALTTGDLFGAERYFNDAIRVDSKDFKSILGLGQVAYKRGNANRALECYTLAAEESGYDISVMPYFVGLCYEHNKMRDLESFLRKVLIQNRSNLDVQYCLAGCFYKQRQFSKALQVINQMLMLDATRQDALELKAKIEKDEGVTVPEQVVRYSGDFQSVEYSETMSSVIASIELDKKNKNFDVVIQRVQDVLDAPLASQSERNVARLLRAEALACQGEFVQAKEEFNSLVHDAASSGRAYVGLGAVLATEDNFLEAEEHFNKALSREPKNDAAIAGLGICALKSGKLEESWNLFQRSLLENPENGRALMGLVQLAYQMNRLEQLRVAFERYLEFKPIDLDILYAFAGCLYALGKKEEAARQLDKIRIFDPQNERAIELLEKIEQEQRANQ